MAAIATQTIEVDLTPGGVSPFLYVSQGDYGTRSLVFNFYLNGQPYNIPSDVTTITLEGVTKGGNLFNNTCSFSANTSTATGSLTSDMTTDAGLDICQLCLKNSSGQRLGTANFFIEVELSPLDTKVLYGNVYWSNLAKSWAIGGTGIRSDENTNNSKFWSDEASRIINDARYRIDQNTYEISVLKSRINQYVVPSTEHPTEVVAARVGFDGTVYDDLGTAIRSQVIIYGYSSDTEEIYIRHNSQ